MMPASEKFEADIAALANAARALGVSPDDIILSLQCMLYQAFDARRVVYRDLLAVEWSQPVSCIEERLTQNLSQALLGGMTDVSFQGGGIETMVAVLSETFPELEGDQSSLAFTAQIVFAVVQADLAGPDAEIGALIDVDPAQALMLLCMSDHVSEKLFEVAYGAT